MTAGKRMGITLIALIVVSYLYASNAIQAQSLPLLHQSGVNILDANNNVVHLRGVNLGDWLVMEPWMCPGVTDSDQGGAYQDMYSIIKELDTRFGVTQEQTLIKAYEDAYITSADIANIKAQGLNVIRVPVWWGDFYTLGSGTGGTGTWRSDAFIELDNVISMAAAQGIYTIIDMHGAIGQQSTNHSTGWQNQNQYWGSSADQAATNTMWQNIATHYKGNSNVAGYDILNEPDNPPSDAAVISAYVSIMNAIRAIDTGHICFIEGTFDQWNWSMLPNPSTEGWTNVVYEMHQYNGSGAGNYSAAQGQITDWNNHSAYNVPDFIGEFNPAQNSNDPNTGLTYWQDVINLYSGSGASWTLWTYKAGGNGTEGGNWGNNWGLYQPSQSVSVPTTTIPTPSIATSTAATIQADWSALTTSNYFVLNPNISAAVIGGNPSPPSTPTGLAATAGNAQVSLTWSATAGAATYNIYRSTSAGGEGTTPITTGVTTNSYTNTGLTNGTTYYYKVAAVNSAGTSGQSSEASATPTAPVEGPYGGTAAAIPGTIQAENYDTGGQGLAYNVTSTNGSDNGYRSDGIDLETCSDTGGGVDIGWTAAGQWFRYTVNVATAGTYTIGFRVSSGASGGTLHLQNSSGTNLTGTVTVAGTGGWQTWTTVNATAALPAGQQVLTVSQDSGGWNINYVTFTSGAAAPPAPTGLTATAGNAQVPLSWTASSGATSYNVYRGTSAGGEGTTAIATGITSTSYTNTGLTNGTTYFYKAAAVNSVGTSGMSNETSATPTAPQPPPAPTGLTGTAGNAQISLSWTASSGATSYNVYRGTSAGGEGTTAIATGVTSTSYTNTGLTNGTTYFFKVAAVSANGTSGMSNEASATPSGPTEGPYGGTPAAVPGTVQAENYDTGGQGLAYNVTSTNGSDNGYRSDGVDLETCSDTGGGVDMGWTAAGQWFRYTVNVATAGTYTVGFRVASGATGGTLHLQNSSGTNLSGAVTVPGTGGWQTWTTVNATVTLPAGQQVLTVSQDTSPNGWNINYIAFALQGAPAAPTGLTASSGNTQVSLSWTASSGATTYNVYRGTSAGGESSTAIATGVTSTTYTNTGLSNGTTYYYKVAAVNSSGTSAMSNEASVTPAAGGGGPIANGTYTMTPQNATGSRVDAAGGGTTNGTAVQIWQATANDPNQKWVFTNTSGSIYTIQPSYDTNLSVEVNGGGSGNGTAVVLWANNGSTAEQWAATAATGGYTFTPQCATASTLNVSGQGSGNGTLLQIWQATGGTNTIFAIGTN